MELNLGGLTMPITAATKAFAILAKRGAGKTYLGGVLAEEFYKSRIPFIVLDPIDVWWGLRLAANGKDKGLPVVVFGVEHADLPLEKDMGRSIAQAVVRENISCVLSTFGMSKNAQRYLVTEFCEELMRINNSPRHVIVEEAHEFVPQRVLGEMGRVFNAVSSFVTLGRNRGIGVTMINQRAATINKDVLTQIDTLLMLRNFAPHDRKSLSDWVEHHAADIDFNKFFKSLPSLPNGEAWVLSPEFLQKFERFKVRKRTTFHPDREKMGEGIVVPQLDTVDVQEFISKFSASLSQKTVAGKPVVVVKAADVVKGLAPTDDSLLVEDLRKKYRELDSKYAQLAASVMEKDLEVGRLRAALRREQEKIGRAVNILQAENILAPSAAPAGGSNSKLEMWLEKLGNTGSSRILKFLAANPGQIFTRPQIGVGAGLSSSSGSFRVYMAELKRLRLIEEHKGEVKIVKDLLSP